MRTLMFAVLAVAGVGMGAPAVASPGLVKVAQVDVRIGTRDRDYRHYDHYRDHRCRTVTIRERHGDRVVVRKVRRCR